MHLPRSFLALSLLGLFGLGVPQSPDARRSTQRSKGLFSGPRIQPGRKHIGRNEPCPCGSGKKFKACHLG